MKLLLILVGLFLLLTMCLPLMLLMAALLPLVWLATIPLAIIGVHLSAPIGLLALVAAFLYFPAKMLGYRV